MGIMIDLLGFLYNAVKDIMAHSKWREEEKLVDLHWPEKSGLRAKKEAEGMTLYWSSPGKLASRLLDGDEVIYEDDKKKRVRRKLVTKSGLVLIGKRSQSQPGGSPDLPTAGH